MSRGIGRLQRDALEYLRGVEEATTQDIAEAVIASKFAAQGQTYFYDPDGRWPTLRALHSLEARGLVQQKRLVRGEDTHFVRGRRDRDGYFTGDTIKAVAPTLLAVWALTPPGSTPAGAQKKIQARVKRDRFARVSKSALQYVRNNKIRPDQTDVIAYQDHRITIFVNNYSYSESMLSDEERMLGHGFVVSVDFKTDDVESLTASGRNSVEAMEAALKELKRKRAHLSS